VLRDALLAFGIIFAVYTKLRVAGAPIGPGEAAIALWLLVTLVREARRDIVWSQASRVLAAFWAAFAAALCIGTMVSFVLAASTSRAHFLHDCAAYAMLAALSVLAVTQRDAARRLRRTVAILVALGSVTLALQIAEAFGAFDLPIEIWFYDRLEGWSTNANQLGLLSLALTLLALHLAETAQRWTTRCLALAGSVMPVAAGVLSKSDAFILTLAVAVPLLLAVHAARAMREAARHPVMPSFIALVSFALAVPAAMGVATLAERFTMSAQSAGQVLVTLEPNLERDVGYRTELLALGLHEAAASGFLGLGPGPHLRRPANLRQPQWDDTPNFEAHNTLVDLLMQGGILALIALGGLGYATLRQCGRAGLVALPLLLLGLAAFGLSHFIVRHPLVWLVVAFALTQHRTTPRPADPASARGAPVNRHGRQPMGLFPRPLRGA